MSGRDTPKASRPDPLSPAQRARCMSRIRATDTRPELIVRRGLHALGLRYRLHDRSLPGSPDLVFPGRRALIYVHGCFWHGHDCPLFRRPATRAEFWAAKIARNRARDSAASEDARERGWRVLTIWECALRGRGRLPVEEVLSATRQWLAADQGTAEIRGELSAELSV